MAKIQQKIETKGKKLSWSKADLARLELGYQMGAPLRVLAAAVGRSPTAVNKALCRFGIRPMGLYSPGAKPGGKRLRLLQSQRFMLMAKTIQVPSDGTEYGGKGKRKNRIFDDGQREASVKLPLLRDACPQQMRRTENAVLDEIWTMADVLLALHSMGFEVTKKAQTQTSHVYFTSLGVREDWQLVVHLNKERLQRGLAPVHVEGVTVN
ncbi:MAG: hypothetical protein ACK5O7_06940 [Holosporales bacterium]